MTASIDTPLLAGKRWRLPRGSSLGAGILALFVFASTAFSAPFTGTVVDASTDEPIPARVYIESEKGEWLFVESPSPEGSALPYREQWVPTPNAVEKHTTISAHPFRIELKSGRYTVTIERGKEYLPQTETIEIRDQPVQKTFRLKRWINLAERGWYSGETHVHRRIRELPNAMLAEDLNVAFPVTFWTTDAFAAPDLKPSRLRRQGPSPFGYREDRGAERIAVDSSHVIFPRNTEYEVFFIGGKRHTLGALFILNHQTVFQEGMPPVAAIAEQAHREGALLDLDKHSWPWAMMLVPIAKVDLFELSNNSVWRTQFGFRRSGVEIPRYMEVERGEDGGLTEWGWLNFGWENWYTLLNCGFRLQPTAGTASGVHPVPLGYSRVYVHTGEKFDADSWMDGLGKGRSFVTTGPMLFATLDGEHPGHVFEKAEPGSVRLLKIESVSERPIDRLEVIVNGELWSTYKPGPDYPQTENGKGGWTMAVEQEIPFDASSWLAVRSVQSMEDGRKRFAHTSPWHIEISGKPLHSRTEETDFLIRRMKAEIERNQGVLTEESLEEFRQALRIYEEIAEKAKVAENK